MTRAERMRTDADTRATVRACSLISSARRTQPAVVTIALTELGQKAGYPIPQLAQDKPVERGTRLRPGKLVVRQSSGGEALAPQCREAIREI